MVRSIIIEDDPIYSKQLSDLIDRLDDQFEIVAVCRNVKESIEAVRSLNPELIFLDIELENGETGFDILKQIDTIDFNVIFTTSHVDENINEIRICGIGFIVKPYMFSELTEIIEKYNRTRKNNSELEKIKTLKGNLLSKNTDENFIWIANGSKLNKVELSNIIYCKSDDPVTYVYLQRPVDGDKVLISSDSIREFESYLKNTNIVRIHNRYLVNILHIKSYIRGEGGYVILHNEESLSISKSFKNDFLTRLGIKG